MKKFITLLLALGAVATTFAQSRDDAKDIILGRKTGTPNDTRTTPQNPNDVPVFGRNKNGTTNYPNTSGDRQAQVDQVNREYDAKIASVRNNPYLSASEKQRTIDQLNKDRAKRIREINGSAGHVYKNNKKHHDGDNEDDDEGNGHGNERSKSKGNNGNHYGWEKGKGNPHRNGGHPGKKD
jgi:hypothetical protein